MTTLAVTVPDMACGACATTITEAVKAIDPTAEVKANLDSKAVEIHASVSPDALTEAIRKAGYRVEG